jgi:hypothetical protein
MDVGAHRTTLEALVGARLEKVTMGRLARLLLLAAVAGVGFVYPLLAPTPHRIDQNHFELIKDGMTMAEVEAIFGVPAGRYDWAEPDSVGRVRIWMALGQAVQAQQGRDTHLGIRFLTGVKTFSDGGVNEMWVSRHGAFTVHFDANDRVAWKSEDGVRIVPPWQRWWQSLSDR